MKKVLSLFLTLMIVFTCFVACGENTTDTNATDVFELEDVVGVWEGNCEGNQFGFDYKIKMTVTFYEKAGVLDNKCQFEKDKDDLQSFYEIALKNEAFLHYIGTTTEELNQYMETSGETYEALVKRFVEQSHLEKGVYTLGTNDSVIMFRGVDDLGSVTIGEGYSIIQFFYQNGSLLFEIDDALTVLNKKY